MKTRDKKKIFGVWLEDDLQKQFKIYCISKGITIETFIEQAIRGRLLDDTSTKATKRTK